MRLPRSIIEISKVASQAAVGGIGMYDFGPLPKDEQPEKGLCNACVHDFLTGKFWYTPKRVMEKEGCVSRNGSKEFRLATPDDVARLALLPGEEE